MTIRMTATGLRRAADVLDALNDIEQNTGVQFDGAYNGHVMVSIPDRAAGEDVTEALRLVRMPDEQPSPNVPAAYAFEFEVP